MFIRKYKNRSLSLIALLSMMLLSGIVSAAELQTNKANYAPQEKVSVNVIGALSGDEDWVGVFPAGSNNGWGNVIAWEWVTKNGQVSLGSQIPKGNYEVRLFFHNVYGVGAKVEAKSNFTVSEVAITPTKADYALQEKVSVDVRGTLSGDRDWVGVFPAGSNNSWGNVIAWEWVTKNGQVSLGSQIPAGNYELRLFFHNVYGVGAKVEAKSNFTVDKKLVITPSKANYNLQEAVSVDVKGGLSGDKDWVGVFPAGSNNSWGNVVAWKWVTKNGQVSLGSQIPAGNYELRLFFHNAYGVGAKVEAKTVFSMGYVYGSEGPYINDVRLKETNDYFAYYPKNNIKGAPLVLISGFYSLSGYRGLMKYLASQGNYVVAHVKHGIKYQEWGDPKHRIKRFEKAISDVTKLGVDTSRLVTMGSSAGGMVSYNIMQYFKKLGYGAKKSFIIDIEGYYASSMTRNDLNKLESDSLILHLGGYTGVQDGSMSEDPRTLLSLSKLLNNNVKKSFIVLDSKDHGYAGGKYEDVFKKKDLLIPIDAMLKYEFFNDNGQYNNAETILFGNYNETVQKVYDATMNFIGGGGNLNNNYVYKCVNKNGGRIYPTIDYCNDHGLQ